MPLDNTGWPEVGNVTVLTTHDQGLDASHWATRCANRIISVADLAPQPIRDQAHAFRERVRGAVQHYIEQAIRSDRATLAAELRQQGHADIADHIVRR